MITAQPIQQQERCMNTAKARNAYQKSEAQTKIHPVKLIHLLYERVLAHLQLAEQGVLTKDAKLRGENLSKAISIISELNLSVRDADKSEAASFLRGLYSAILLELPTVGITHNVEVIRQSQRYLTRLREIWESSAMVEAGLAGDHNDEEPAKNTPPVPPERTAVPSYTEYGAAGPKKFKALDAAACYLHGVSVSI
jgi:flagellar protein FliS